MAQTTITAPFSWELATTTSYFGGGNEIFVAPGARQIKVWFHDDTSNVEGTVKVAIDRGQSVEFTVPAANGVVLVEAPAGAPCLPVIQLDAKATAGTPAVSITVL